MTIPEFFSRINWIDIVIITLLIRSSYVGYRRGIWGELTSLIGIYAALVISLQIYQPVGKFVMNFIPHQDKLYEMYFLTFVAVVIITGFLFAVIGTSILTKLLRLHLYKIVVQVGGVLLGVINGAMLSALVITALDIAPVQYFEDSIHQGSLMGSSFRKVADNVHESSTVIFKR